ncbi:MAG: GNAT family N-acetyltransferase [Anaerolineae bacterium]|nr:GNAT family N-acetyltransferase [Anaerolineae bacterium]
MIMQTITGPDAFSQLADEWDSLAAKSITNTPFQTVAYQESWWRNLHPQGSSLHTIVVRQDNNNLIGIASLYIDNGILHFNGCVEETDYLDLITTAENAEAAWTAVFEAITQPDFPTWHTAALCNIPADSPSRAILAQLAATHSLTCQEEVIEVCPIIPLPDSFDAYLDQIDSKQRREINRKLRRANGADAKLVIISPEDDLDQAVNDFLNLLQKSTFEKRDWLTDGRRAVFFDTAHAAMKAGTLQLMFMEVDGTKAATLFNFDYNGRIWVYNSGLDPEAFGALSLGVVLTAKAIEWAVENGRATFDFLRGNETYKYRFGAQDTEIYKITLNK